MKNRLAAFSRRIIPYNPEFRRLPLVKSVNSALLLQQLDFWFDKHNLFWKFLEPAPKHPHYKEGDSWTEELGMSKEEFRTAFAAIGIPYKSKNQFLDADNKFVQRDEDGNEIEYYYASYFDRQKSLTYYVRNDELLDKDLTELIQASSPKDRIRPERPAPEDTDDVPAPSADPVVTVVAVDPPKSAKVPRKTAEEIEAEKAAVEDAKRVASATRERKAEQKRLAAEARAEAKRLKQEQLELDNQWRYELFGGKERYTRFNAWFWGVYLKSNTLDNPGMFYSIMMNNLRDGGEKYRYIVVMFDQAEQKIALEAKVQQEQERMESVETIDDNDQLESMLSIEEHEALTAANLDSDAYDFLLRRLVVQPDHKFRMMCIERETERQIVRNERRARLEAGS
jgi:hypothetical protein